MKVTMPISPIFILKFGRHDNMSLEQSEKAGRIGNLRSNTYHMVKIL